LQVLVVARNPGIKYSYTLPIIDNHIPGVHYVRASPRNNTYAWSVSYGECSKSCARGKCRRACVTASKRRQTWRYSKTLYKDSNFGSLAIVVLWNVSLAVGEIYLRKYPGVFWWSQIIQITMFWSSCESCCDTWVSDRRV